MTSSLLLLAALAVPAGAETTAGGQTVRVQFYAPDVVRVLKWTAGGSPEKQSLVVIARPDPGVALTREETAGALTLASARVRVRDLQGGRGGAIRDARRGESFSPRREPAAFTPVTTPFEKAWSVAQTFRLTPDEGIYGLGQHQDGVMNYRGRAVKLVQTNTDAVTPVARLHRRLGPAVGQRLEDAVRGRRAGRVAVVGGRRQRRLLLLPWARASTPSSAATGA